MIDIETEVFSIVSAEVRKKYPKIYMTGEYVKSPPSFPCVSLIETDNQVYRNTRDSGCIENHAQVLYEVNVYSNKTSGKKTEYSDDSWSRNMREFYHEYVEPTLKEIATDTKRQADKKEQTIVKVGNRTINDAVTTQKEANGFSFTE